MVPTATYGVPILLVLAKIRGAWPSRASIWSARLEQNMKEEPVEKIEVSTIALTTDGRPLMFMRSMLMIYCQVSWHTAT